MILRLLDITIPEWPEVLGPVAPPEPLASAPEQVAEQPALVEAPSNLAALDLDTVIQFIQEQNVDIQQQVVNQQEAVIHVAEHVSIEVPANVEMVLPPVVDEDDDVVMVEVQHVECQLQNHASRGLILRQSSSRPTTGSFWKKRSPSFQISQLRNQHLSRKRHQLRNPWHSGYRHQSR